MEEKANSICKILHNTYDGKILNDIDDIDISESFKRISEKYKDGNDGNVPLLNIINNYFNGILPSPKFISGPMSLTYQTSSKYDMKVYIFGELHGKSNQCRELGINQLLSNMDISNYLHQLFLNSDKFIDFYLEDELFRTIEPDRNKDFINMLRYDFDKCLNPTKRSTCIFKTVRTHFVDARIIQKGSIFMGTNDIENFIRNLSKEKSLRQNNDDTIYKLLKLKSYKDISNYILDIATNIPIINKELNRCSLDKTLIINIFRSIIPGRYFELFNIDKWNSLFRTKSSDAERIELLVLIQTPIVDVYTVARMFKTFKKTKYLPDKPRHIIYYAGDSHSEIVRRFLEKLDFEDVFLRHSDVKSSTRCLNIENLTLNFE
jgi:hypothetical protein